MGTHRQLGDWARARCCERCVRESFTWNAREASPHFSAPPPPNLESSSPKSSFLPKGLLALARRAFPSQACSCPSTGPAHPKSGRPAESQSRAGAKPAVRRVVCELRRRGDWEGGGAFWKIPRILGFSPWKRGCFSAVWVLSTLTASFLW